MFLSVSPVLDSLVIVKSSDIGVINLSFIQSDDEYSLNTYHVPGTVPGTGDTTVNRQSPTVIKRYILEGERGRQ